jgi:hypothetical protein
MTHVVNSLETPFVLKGCAAPKMACVALSIRVTNAVARVAKVLMGLVIIRPEPLLLLINLQMVIYVALVLALFVLRESAAPDILGRLQMAFAMESH